MAFLLIFKNFFFPSDSPLSPLLTSYPADLHAPLQLGTRALQTGTRSQQRWQQKGRTCSAIACPGKSSIGPGGTAPLVHLHARFVHCFVHLWRAHGASFAVHWALRLLLLLHLHQHLRSPLWSPAGAWWCQSVSGSGILSEGRNSQRRGEWLRSWRALQGVRRKAVRSSEQQVSPNEKAQDVWRTERREHLRTTWMRKMTEWSIWEEKKEIRSTAFTGQCCGCSRRSI